MRVKIIFQALFLCLILNLGLVIGSEANAKRINCERYTENGLEFFRKKSHYDSWFPEELNINVSEFEEVTGKQYVRWVSLGSQYDGSKKVSVKFTLFPDSKMTANSSNLIGQIYARYKCDMTPKEVLQHKTGSAATNNKSSKSAGTGCVSGMLKNCSDTEICKKATTSRSGSLRWETASISAWVDAANPAVLHVGDGQLAHHKINRLSNCRKRYPPIMMIFGS